MVEMLSLIVYKIPFQVTRTYVYIHIYKIKILEPKTKHFLYISYPLLFFDSALLRHNGVFSLQSHHSKGGYSRRRRWQSHRKIHPHCLYVIGVFPWDGSLCASPNSLAS